MLEIAALDGNSDASCIIKERMTQALRYFKESTGQQVLVQVWAPVKNGNRCVLTTSGQPFVLDPPRTKLLQYRTVSLMYTFSVDEENGGYLGLPGRVFKQKLPEWTPNVQYYSSKEYLRLDHALLYNVRGTLALPVFEPSGHSCLGVVELIMTSQKINYAHDVDKVCKALEAVNLKSFEILDHPSLRICNEGRQAALAEILEILTVVCESQKLPLAQTWVPCKHRTILAQGGGSIRNCLSFDGSCRGQVCMSTTDVAFYVVDAHMWGFREGCVEHHLQKGQGVAGKAFETRRPCFCTDIQEFSKSKYPLVHYARMFGLSGCLAVCLQSTLSGNDDYILEFFLPSECKNIREQRALLNAIATVMRQCFHSLKVVGDMNSQQLSFEIIDIIANQDCELEPKSILDPSDDNYLCTFPVTSIPEGNDDSDNEGNASHDSREQLCASDEGAEKDGNIIVDHSGSGESRTVLSKKNNRPSGKKRGKAEKLISLEVLQQYFSGSLKDAAKSLGVCPTTMKRICRQYGISRWPSRKINKVNRSLSKLKHVIESVQGIERTINLTSVPCPLPVAVDSLSCPAKLDRSQTNIAIESDKDTLPLKMPEKDEINVQPGPRLDDVRGSKSSKSSSSSEGSMNAPTSQGSCQGSPANEVLLDKTQIKQGADTTAASRFPLQPIHYATDVDTQEQLPRKLIRDSGSSKDLSNLCNAPMDGQQVEPAVAPSNILRHTAIQERTVTIKASYKYDIIRFKLHPDDGIIAVKEEVAKRLKLEMGTFDIKYLDDDHEWVMLSCDADLEECIEISRLSGAHVIRLLVQDIVANHGSSCESSGD
ncbi:protein NLP3-like [Ananas comosus]|uniref:Protein NLP3-like n=1 Tax=Ananas comosus TaxID=4615 RepID=A0A6P5FSG5_ANACO|nr:protein NLP3-like [Ananas comosus]